MRSVNETLELGLKQRQLVAKVAVKPAQDAALRRFPKAIRREVSRLVRGSERMADLMLTFPGILAALAVKRGGADSIAQAHALIEDGAALKSVARVLELPMWLRALPPEAFETLPQRLPAGERFSRHIATRLPVYAKDCPLWLSSVCFGYDAVGEDFAIWLAEQGIFGGHGNPRRMFAVLTAYAWFSCNPETEANRLIVVPWRREIAFDTALCAAKAWFNRVRLVLQLPPGTLTDPWLQAGTADSYTFEPLLDQHQILAEAHAMQNCADQYADRLARNNCRLFSIKRRGHRIATMEIGPHNREVGVLTITQLKARHNMAAPLEVWQAAYQWLAGQHGLKRIAPLATPSAALTFDQQAWERLLAPYRAAKDGADWLDHEARHLMFCSFDAELAELANRGCVSSWLFT